MKTMKKWCSALPALALALSLAACSGGAPAAAPTPSPTPSPAQIQETPAQAGHYPVTITNVNYAREPVEFTYEKAPQRVITFWSNSLETMLALGLGDRVVMAVGMDEASLLPELKDEAEAMRSGAQYYTAFKDSNAALSKETAMLLEPDFILGWKSSFSEKTIGDTAYWNENGVGTYIALNSNDVSALRTVENEYQDILAIGKIFDVEDKAQALVDEMKAEVERVTAAAQGQPQKTVLVAEFLGEKIWTYDETYLAGDMVKAMGGELLNIGREIGVEDIINADPDVLILLSDELTQVTENPACASMKAVRNGQVHHIDLSEVYTSGVRTILGLNHIGQILYPQLYAGGQ